MSVYLPEGSLGSRFFMISEAFSFANCFMTRSTLSVVA